MESIRIGLIGSGGMAGRRAATFARLDGCVLRALAARNPETGPPLAREHAMDLHADWRDLVAREDIDAVAICTHNEPHGRMALAALQAGKHVFVEYPLARRQEEADRLAGLVSAADRVLRVAHTPVPRFLHEQVSRLGPLLEALFARFTPGRGARPGILFNLEQSGPPALFFVYHVYPLVELFGPAAWVSASARYVDLREDLGYRRFANAVSVGFARGGLGQWTWSGGIEIRAAEEYQRLVLEGGTLLRGEDGWQVSTCSGIEPLPDEEGAVPSLESRFLEDIRCGEDGWREAFAAAYQAVRICLAAERSMREGQRVALAEAR